MLWLLHPSSTYTPIAFTCVVFMLLGLATITPSSIPLFGHLVIIDNALCPLQQQHNLLDAPSQQLVAQGHS